MSRGVFSGIGPTAPRLRDAHNSSRRPIRATNASLGISTRTVSAPESRFTHKMATPEAQEVAAKQRIINHMNADHHDSVRYALYHHTQ